MVRRNRVDYAGLREQVDRTVTSLNALGLGRGDRVANSVLYSERVFELPIRIWEPNFGG